MHILYIHIITVDTKIFAFCDGFLVKGMIYDILEKFLFHIYAFCLGYSGYSLVPQAVILGHLITYTYTCNALPSHFIVGSLDIKSRFYSGNRKPGFSAVPN